MNITGINTIQSGNDTIAFLSESGFTGFEDFQDINLMINSQGAKVKIESPENGKLENIEKISTSQKS